MPSARDRAAALIAALVAAVVLLGATSPIAAQPSPFRDRLDAGFRLFSEKEPAAARAVFEEVQLAAREARDLRAEAEANRGLGMARLAEKDFGGAKESNQEALRLFDLAGDKRGRGQAFMNLGYLAWTQGDWPAHREAYESAARAFDEAGARVDKALALHSLTFATSLSWIEREALIVDASSGLLDADPASIRGQMLHAWGDILFGQSRFAESIEKLAAARPLLESAPDRSRFPRLLTSIGRTLRVQGDLDGALDTYREALAIQEREGDSLGASQTESAIGATLLRLGRTREALACQERALALAERAGLPFQIAIMRTRVGELLAALGDWQRALPLLEPTENAMPAHEVTRLVFRTMALRAAGRLDEALADAELAVAKARESAVADDEFYALAERSTTLAALGRREAARADALDAESALERVRTNLLPEDRLKQSFSERYRGFFDHTVGLLESLGQPGEALEATERGRARAFLDLLATRAVPLSSGDRDRLTRMTAAKPAAGAGANPATAPARSPRRGDAELRSLVSVQPFPIAAMATTVARLRSTLVSYWVAPEVTFVFVMAGTGELKSFRIPVTAARLAKLAGRLESRAQLASRGAPDSTAPDTDSERGAAGDGIDLPLHWRSGSKPLLSRDTDPALRELYGLLIRPIRDALPRKPGSRLTILPHGPLFALSFAALKDQRGRYLVEDYEIHYAPSVAALEYAARKAEGPHRQRQLLLLADPLLDPKLQAQEKLGRLPGALREAEQIASLFAPRQVTVLRGAAARETDVRHASASRSVLHLATHGVVRDDRPLESFLALAPGGGEDGRLSSAEIYGLDLDADLVVMSACRSGRGHITGDGVIGFARAFSYAGAPSLLATVWDLPDETAWRLLPDFYASWRRTGDKAGALREAQLALLARLRVGELTIDTPAGRVRLPEHPALWAPFVLLGAP